MLAGEQAAATHWQLLRLCHVLARPCESDTRHTMHQANTQNAAMQAYVCRITVRPGSVCVCACIETHNVQQLFMEKTLKQHDLQELCEQTKNRQTPSWSYCFCPVGRDGRLLLLQLKHRDQQWQELRQPAPKWVFGPPSFHGINFITHASHVSLLVSLKHHHFLFLDPLAARGHGSFNVTLRDNYMWKQQSFCGPKCNI